MVILLQGPLVSFPPWGKTWLGHFVPLLQITRVKGMGRGCPSFPRGPRAPHSNLPILFLATFTLLLISQRVSFCNMWLLHHGSLSILVILGWCFLVSHKLLSPEWPLSPYMHSLPSVKTSLPLFVPDMLVSSIVRSLPSSLFKLHVLFKSSIMVTLNMRSTFNTFLGAQHSLVNYRQSIIQQVSRTYPSHVTETLCPLMSTSPCSFSSSHWQLLFYMLALWGWIH